MLRTVFIAGFLLFSQVAVADVYQDFEATLTKLKDAYLKQYGLFEYKRQKFGWDAERQFQRLLDQGKRNSSLTVEQAQALVVEMVRSTRDYHGRATLGARPDLKLGIWVRSVAGYVFIIRVDSATYTGKAQVGDELTTFDGLPAYRALMNVSEQRYPNMPETDRRNAERILTERSGSGSDPIPGASQAQLTFRRGTQTFSESVTWKESTGIENEGAEWRANPVPALLRGNLISNWQGSVQRISDLPKLGNLIWEETDSSTPFYAWISKLQNGKKVGMIRVPTFAFGSAAAYTQAVQAFAKLLERMNAETDVLILDIHGNRGGMLDYAYALTSFFFESNVETYRFQYRLSSNLVAEASSFYSDLMKIQTLDDAYAYFGAMDYCGYPIDLDFIADLKTFALGIIQDANTQLPMGKARYYNMSKIKPNRGIRYLKPLVVAIDAGTASAGDAFAALLQDNYRATIVGAQSAGAGALVGNPFQLENALGFTSFSLPIALGYRYRNAVIENVGVSPDIRLDFLSSDLRGGQMDHYRREFERIVSKLSVH